MKISSTAYTTKNTRAERMSQLGLRPDQFEERFTRSSGPGGQHVNKVSTAVTLTCAQENVSVTVQEHRSQRMNREAAWERVLDQIARRREARLQEQRTLREKRRRQNARRPAGLKRRILEAKKRRGEIKKMRSRVEAKE